ncbi:MAG TPA: PhoU domain-containing protein [Xanthomonadales bacterium]|nr:PhoU domain-containing protein [Xanthomonadales bacterium]
MSHFEQRLQADLDAIRDWVWSLGSDVEKALRNAKQALLQADVDLAYATVLNDHPINRKSRACDRMCHAFIARHLPGAGHLREIAATIRVNVALERVGDYAVTISREAVQLQQALPRHLITEIDSVADASFQILHDSRLAFRDDNAEQAKALMRMAKRVEHDMDAIYADLFDTDNDLNARSRLSLFVVFNMLKRVADQAKNLCDQTVYAVRGIAKIPKVYNILFLDQADSLTGPLALFVARKNFPTQAQFRLAVAGDVAAPQAELQEFLTAKGLDAENLESESLASLQYELAEFDVVVALQGNAIDYIGTPPFHTTALHWDISKGEQELSDLYRLLHQRIHNLIDLLAGEEAA